MRAFYEAGASPLPHQPRHHLRRLHARQSLVEALVRIGEARVVNTQKPQNRGVEVMHRYGVAHDIVGEVVGFAVDRAGFAAAARHPHREATRMVVAPVILLRKATLRIDRASELASPDHQRVVEEALVALRS